MWIKAICYAVLLWAVAGQPPAAETTSAGFLADEIPLEVVTTTPTAIAREETVEIQGQQALTVSEDYGVPRDGGRFAGGVQSSCHCSRFGFRIRDTASGAGKSPQSGFERV